MGRFCWRERSLSSVDGVTPTRGIASRIAILPSSSLSSLQYQEHNLSFSNARSKPRSSHAQGSLQIPYTLIQTHKTQLHNIIFHASSPLPKCASPAFAPSSPSRQPPTPIHQRAGSRRQTASEVPRPEQTEPTTTRGFTKLAKSVTKSIAEGGVEDQMTRSQAARSTLELRSMSRQRSTSLVLLGSMAHQVLRPLLPRQHHRSQRRPLL